MTSLTDPDDTLAMFGGRPAVHGQIKPFNTLRDLDVEAITQAMSYMAQDGRRTSGYLAGRLQGGGYVQRIEFVMQHKHKVRHAIACNSATSGLFACCAIFGPERRIAYVSPLGMSATAAAAALAGHSIIFSDVDDWFCLDPDYLRGIDNGHIILATNLFGHPAQLVRLREIADKAKAVLVEDNAQAIWASEDNRLTGTIGHLGVLSFNVHKHINAGEGGMILTNDDNYARQLRLFINHGENSGEPPGMNLRMTELTAALVLSQIDQSIEIVKSRRRLWQQLTGAIGDRTSAFDVHIAPIRKNCISSAYCLPVVFDTIERSTGWWLQTLQAEGVPIHRYAPLMTDLKWWQNYKGDTPRAHNLWNDLGIFELLAIDPTDEQITQIGEAFRKVSQWKSQESRLESSTGLSS